jgi:hypothetical protein
VRTSTHSFNHCLLSTIFLLPTDIQMLYQKHVSYIHIFTLSHTFIQPLLTIRNFFFYLLISRCVAGRLEACNVPITCCDFLFAVFYLYVQCRSNFFFRDGELSLRHKLTDHSLGVVSVVLSRDAKMLASSSLDSAIHIWNTETGGWGEHGIE